jgi:predicted permease
MITDLRIAVRSLARSRWFAGTAIATVALSMVLASTTFAVVDGVLFKPLPYPNADRLFTVYGARNERGAERLSFTARDAEHWRTVPGLRISTYQRYSDIGSLGDSTRSLNAMAVERDFFDVLGQHPVIGALRSEDFDVAPDGPRAVLLSYRLWKSAFGANRSAIGQRVASGLPFSLVVAGVLPPDFVFPVSNARDLPDAIVPLIPDPAARSGRNTLRGLARLDDGVEPDAIRQALTAMAQAHRGDVRAADGQPAGFERVTLESLVDSLGRYERQGFRLALGAALGLVLLACVNVAGLVGARGRERLHELIVRVALGARRRDLMRLLVAESVVIGLAGGLLGAALAWPTLGSVVALLPETLVYLKQPSVDWRVVVFSIVSATTVVVLMTMPTMMFAMRSGVRSRAAHVGGATARSRTAGRFALVTAQTSLGMVLVLGGALLLASFIKLALEDTGLAIDNTARVSVTSSRLGDLLAEVRRTPGVVAVAATDARLLLGSHYEVPYAFPPTRGIGRNGARVTADYFEVAGVRLVAGRLPTREEFDSNPSLMVISDVLADRAWPGQSAVGRVVDVSPNYVPAGGGPSPFSAATIVAVVADAKLQSLDEDGPSGEIYLPLAEPTRPSAFTVILRSAGDPDAVAMNVARRLRAWDSGVSITSAESLRASVWGSVKPRTFNTVLYGSLAAAALLLVAVGIGGLVATAVARRRREIGIRMALGADRHCVRRLVVLENMRPVLAGLAIGAIASYWTAELVKANLWGTTPYDWTAWMATIFIVLGASMLAAYVPARRASRVNPVAVLRAE